MKYSMTVDREVYIQDEEWTQDVLRLVQAARCMFCQSAAKEAFALMRTVNAGLTNLYGQTLRELLEAADYQEWAEKQAEAILKSAESVCRTENESWLAVHFKFEIDVYDLKFQLEELSRFLIEERNVPFKEGVLTFWEWYAAYLRIATNPFISTPQIAAYERQFGKFRAYHDNAAIDEIIRPYPDLSEEEEEDAGEGRLDEGVQPLLTSDRKTCLWIAETFNDALAAYGNVRDAYADDIARSDHSIRRVAFENGSSIRFTFVGYLDTFRGMRFDYVVIDNVFSMGVGAMTHLLAKANTDESIVIALGKVKDLTAQFSAPPFPGASPEEDKGKTEPLQAPPALRSCFGWLREDKACAAGAYEITTTDLGTFRVFKWGMQVFCASDIEDLKGYAKKIEDEAWLDGDENPMPLDQEVWCAIA